MSQPRRRAAVVRRRRLTVSLTVLATLIGVALTWGTHREDTHSDAAARPAITSDAGSSAPSRTPSQRHAAATPWHLQPPQGRGHLAKGSNPSVLPGPVLIADRANSRLLVVDPQGRVRWRFPRPGDLSARQRFRVPDDAFVSPNGRDIVATEEDYSVVSIIDIATRHLVGRYGHPGIPGSGIGYVHNPDDAMLLPGGDLLSADIKNCRVLLLHPQLRRPFRVFGHPGNCTHNPPQSFGSPNGAFPMRNGNYLITEITGDWVDSMSLHGKLQWAVHPPGIVYPSDSNQVGPNKFLTVGYTDPGKLIEFNRQGRSLWRYRPRNAAGRLNHPSLAMPLPNGDILLNDDYNNRVLVIDPHTNRIVWQYGHRGQPGRRPGQLRIPDGVDLLPPYSLDVTHRSTMGRPNM